MSKVIESIANTVVIFFCVITWSVVCLLRYFNQKIDEFSKMSPADMSSNMMTVYLENWRRQHTLVCQLIEEIKSFFGLILLISLAHAFVSLITDSFEITVAFQSLSFLRTTFMVRFLQHFVLFSFICFGTDLIQNEVN